MLALKVALNAYEIDINQERKDENHSAAREFWRKRIGTFQSNEDFIKSIQKARKNISMIPKRRTLGLDWKELGPDNIRVNSISPGAIATPIFWGGSQRANTLSEEENEKKLEKLKGNLAKAVPLNRSGLAIDIAEAALYLASEAGSFISCQDIVVDGGRTAMFNE